MKFTNPGFQPARVDLDILNSRKQNRTRERVKSVTEHIAEAACEALLRQLPAPHSWRNANAARRNQPGYDYLIDERIRIQVKGTDAIEQVGWAHKPDLAHPSLDYDVLLFVHVGICLDPAFGRFTKYQLLSQPYVDYYVIPNAVVREWVSSPRYANKGRVELYFNQRPFSPTSRQHLGQTREILSCKDRFEILEKLIADQRAA